MSAAPVPLYSVLSEPPAVRIQQFREFAVAHPLLVEAKDRLMETITESAPNSLILVFGPTGVGKTTLLSKVRQLLTESATPDLEADPGHLPVVVIEAAPPESRTFSWRAHFKRMLHAMNEPLIDSKRRFGSIDRSAELMTPIPMTGASQRTTITRSSRPYAAGGPRRSLSTKRSISSLSLLAGGLKIS